MKLLPLLALFLVGCGVGVSEVEARDHTAERTAAVEAKIGSQALESDLARN